MNKHKQDYIAYRLEKSKESYKDARLLAKNERWNAAINRLYYACYYSVSALLLKNNISTHTHSGIKIQFGIHFVKTGILSRDDGKLFADLMDWRQKGDYGDMFDFDKKTIESLLEPVKTFLKKVHSLLDKA